MAAQLFKSSLYRLRSASRKRKTAGFTLTELLVGMVIASIVVSGLMYLVVELLQTNQRESVQTETQRDMQIALDYISSEVREAVYVYSGGCLQGQGSIASGGNGGPTLDYCPGIVNHIISTPANSMPVIAFWKLDSLPLLLQKQCDDNDANTPDPALNVPCVSGRTYSLVVYFLRKNQASEIWEGKARITRYELSQYKSDGTVNTTYVNPDQAGVTFRIWPYKRSGNTLTPPPLQAPKLIDDPVVLTDFVDDTARDYNNDGTTEDSTVSCPADYAISPTITTAPFSTTPPMRSFYACVRVGPNGTEEAGNQDIFISLRGNASGRSGIDDNSFLPTLQTQVLRRGIVDKIPAPL